MKSPPPTGKVRRQVLMYVVELLTLFAIYFTTARLGLSLGAVSRFATLVWFPSGTAMAALLLLGIVFGREFCWERYWSTSSMELHSGLQSA